MNEWMLLAIGLVLTLGTGAFVASEFSLVNLDRAELEARQQRGETRLGSTIAALRHTSTHLSSAQLGITLTTLLTGYTMEPAFRTLLTPAFEAIGTPETLTVTVSTVLAVAIATLLSMIFGELIPKNAALAVPLATAKIVAPLQRGFTWLFKPAVLVLNGSANWILRRMGIEPKEELSGARSAEELTSLLRRSAMEGVLDGDAATLLSRTLRFTEHTAGDIMTPRPRVHAIDRASTVQDVIDLAASTGHSRFPVIEDDLDTVAGIVHVKQAVSVPRERRAEVPVLAIAEDAVRVPESVGLDALLGDLRERGYQMAVVVDEYGGTAGLATLEDLVEEIVGEVADEHDRSRADVIRTPGWLTFPGILRADEALERAGVAIPEDSAYETVGGYMMYELGRIPAVGDEVETEAGVLRVERLDGRRVDRVKFIPNPVAASDGGAE